MSLDFPGHPYPLCPLVRLGETDATGLNNVLFNDYLILFLEVLKPLLL